jgi:hypothetical protein
VGIFNILVENIYGRDFSMGELEEVEVKLAKSASFII